MASTDFPFVKTYDEAPECCKTCRHQEVSDTSSGRMLMCGKDLRIPIRKMSCAGYEKDDEPARGGEHD